MWFSNKTPMYDIIEESNGILVLDIAAPGFRKEDLKASLDNGVLNISSTREYDESNYVYKGIPSTFAGKWRIPLNFKIDMITCGDGLIRVLLSKKIELPDTNIIPIQ